MLKKLAKESLVYGLSGILTRFISVFLTPIYTAIFVPADYGVLSLVTTLSALLSILLILSLDNSMGRWYYDNESDDDRKTTLNTFLWSCFGVALILAIALLASRDLIANVILDEPAVSPLLALTAINLPLTAFVVFTTNVLRMQRRPVATTVFSLTTSLLTIGLNVFFVIGLRSGLAGVFYAQITTSVVAVVWTFILFRRSISVFWFSRERWVQMFFFSMPLIPATLAYWVINLSGTYFIRLMSDANEVGLYQIGFNLASGMALFTNAFQMAWAPFAFSIHKQPEAKQTYARVLLAFLAVSCSLALGLMLFAPEALMILTQPSYYGAALVAGLLGFNHILLGISAIAAIGPGIAKNNKPFGIAMLVSAVLLVVLNLALVPSLGKEGAAISVLLSQCIVPLVVFAHGQKIYPIPYRFVTAFLILGSSFGIGLIVMRVNHYWEPSLTVGILFKASVVLLYCTFLFGLLRKDIGPSNLIPKGASAT